MLRFRGNMRALFWLLVVHAALGIGNLANLEDFGQPLKTHWSDLPALELRVDSPTHGTVYNVFQATLRVSAHSTLPVGSSLILVADGHESRRVLGSEGSQLAVVQGYERPGVLWCPKQLPHSVFAVVQAANGSTLGMSEPSLFWTTEEEPPHPLQQKPDNTEVHNLREAFGAEEEDEDEGGEVSTADVKADPAILSRIFARAPLGFRVTAVFTSCGRFELLERTLRTFMEHNVYPIDKYVIVEDSGDTAVRDAIIERFGDDVMLLFNRQRMGQLYSIDRAYSEVATEWLFHCEDDWTFTRTGDFMAQSMQILLHDRKIFQVHIADSGAHERVYPEDVTDSGVTFNYVKRHHVLGAFAFHPGLRRTDDFRRLQSPMQRFYTEDAISAYIGWAGFVSAKLPETYCEHDDVFGGAHASKHMEYFGCNPKDWDHLRPSIEIVKPDMDEVTNSTVVFRFLVGGIGAAEAPTTYMLDGVELGQTDMPLFGGEELTWQLSGISPGLHNATIIVAEPNNLRSRAQATVRFKVEGEVEGDVDATTAHPDVLQSTQFDTSSPLPSDEVSPSVVIHAPADGSSLTFSRASPHWEVALHLEVVGLDLDKTNNLVVIVFLDGHEELGRFHTTQVETTLLIPTARLGERRKLHSINALVLDNDVDTGASGISEFFLRPT